MKFNFDTKIINQRGLSISDVAVLLLISNDGVYTDTAAALELNDLIFQQNGRYFITYKGRKLLNDVLLSSESINNSRELDRLSRKLISMFPQETKAGTGLFYRCGVKECSMQLRIFFKMFSDDYSYQDIEDATLRYTQYYNNLGDRTLQRTLLNFIIKVDGEKTFSDLATWIENKDSNVASSKTYEDIVTA